MNTMAEIVVAFLHRLSRLTLSLSLSLSLNKMHVFHIDKGQHPEPSVVSIFSMVRDGKCLINGSAFRARENGW